MKNKKFVLIGGLLVALLVIGVIGATGVYAQSQSSILPHGSGPGGGRGLGMGQPELEAAAKALGMTTADLSSALQSGTTLEQLASEKGVDLQTVKDAINAVHREEVRSRIQQGLSDGTISQEKANWLLEGLNKGFLDGPGLGFGFGSAHGPGFGPGSNQTPPAQPTQPTQQSGV